MPNLKLSAMNAGQIAAYLAAVGYAPNYGVATASVSSAELQAINTVPKVLTGPPGAGKVIQAVGGGLVYNYGTTPYDNPSIPGVYFPGTQASDSKVQLRAGNIFYAEEDSWSLLNEGGARGATSLAEAENKALVFTDQVNWTGGDGTLFLVVQYQILTLP